MHPLPYRRRRPRTRRAVGAPPRNRGVASALAMIYLVVFTTLALGFYAQVTLSSQLARNERRGATAQNAAEAGVAFVRYQLSRVKVAPNVAAADVFDEVQWQLQTKLDPTPNLGTRHVGDAPGKIELPEGPAEYIELGAGVGRFRATLTPNTSGGIRALVVGTDNTGSYRRAIRVDFGRDEKPSSVLDYGVATNGPLVLSKGLVKGDPAALGDVLSTAAGTGQVSLSGGTASIDGKVYLSSPTGTVTGDGSVAGVSDPTLRKAGVVTNVPVPEFPGVDPTPFIKYMEGKETLITGNTGVKNLTNIRIKAGANPTLGNSPTVEGVILIEAPNQITFSGASGTIVRGVIVVVNPAEATGTNKITFTGGVQMYGPETLPDSFGELKTMTGSAILAPKFTVEMSGGSASIGGTIVAKSLVLSGASGGTVAGNIILTGTGPLTIPQDSFITVKSPLGTATPRGLVFTHSYKVDPKSYLETVP